MEILTCSCLLLCLRLAMASKICQVQNNSVYFGITPRNFAYLQYEKYIHRMFYPYIIHPYTSFRIIWERVVSCNIIIRLSFICFVWASLHHASFGYQAISFFFQFVCLLDIVLNFFTGYVNHSTDAVIFEPKKIALNYLTGRFIFDVAAAIPFDLFFYYLNDAFRIYDYSTLCLLSSPSTFWCSLVRLPAFAVYLINWGRILVWDRIMVGMILMCVVLYLGVLFSTNLCLCHMQTSKSEFPDLPDLSMNSFLQISGVERLERYFDTILLIILNSLYYEIAFPIKNDFVRCLVLNISLVGKTLFMTYFINYVIMRMKNHEKFMDMEYQVRTFVSLRQFNPSLKNKTLLYFHILLENRFTKDDEIFNYIPDTFKGDIFYHIFLPLLRNFYCFEDLPTFVLRRLAESMGYQLYLPNELVMSKDEPVLRLYFVQRGTVALYSAKDIELYHFEAGSNFNGRSLILEDKNSSTYAISIEVTEVYRLNHEDFINVMSDFPELYQNMRDKIRLNRKDSAYFQ